MCSKDVQTLSLNQLISVYNDAKRELQIHCEIQTLEYEVPKVKTFDKYSQTQVKRLMESCTETTDDMLIPMLESLSISRNIDNDGGMNTNRTEIKPSLTITPRNIGFGATQTSESRSTKVDGSYQTPEGDGKVNFSYKIGVDSIDKTDASKTQHSFRSSTKPFSIKNSQINKGRVFSKQNDSRTLSKNHFNKRSDSQDKDTGHLYSPIKEELNDLSSSYFKPIVPSKGTNDKKMTAESMQSRKTDFDTTSAQMQNFLTSKYDVSMDSMCDFRKQNIYRVSTTLMRPNLNQTCSEIRDRMYPFQDIPFVSPFNHISSKFNRQKHTSPEIKSKGRCDMKQLIKGASSRD